MEITNINQLDLNGTYTYADYLLWKIKERVELFKGRIFKMSPAPAFVHQAVSRNLTGILFTYFEGKKCQLMTAPFDVRLPDKNGEIYTVVQPDLCIICDEHKIDEKGCIGAPDLIIEILSPGNSKKEMKNKFQLYEEAGVLEYWIVHPIEKCVWIYILENDKFVQKDIIFDDEKLTSHIFPNIEIDAMRVFRI